MALGKRHASREIFYKVTVIRKMWKLKKSEKHDQKMKLI